MQKKHVFSMVFASAIASLSVHHVLLMLGAKVGFAVFMAAVVAFVGAICSGTAAIARVAGPTRVDRLTDVHLAVGIVGGVAGFALPMTVVAVLHQLSNEPKQLLSWSTICMIASGALILRALMSLLMSPTPTASNSEGTPAGEATPAETK